MKLEWVFINAQYAHSGHQSGKVLVGYSRGKSHSTATVLPLRSSGYLVPGHLFHPSCVGCQQAKFFVPAWPGLVFTWGQPAQPVILSVFVFGVAIELL